MTNFNMYSSYSYAANDFKSSCDDKILVDLKKLDSLKMYDEILNFITTNFGVIGAGQDIDFPNNIKLMLRMEEDTIVALAIQNNKRIFGKCWERPKEEENKN